MGPIRDVLRLPNCRRIEVGWLATLAGEMAGTIALLVYAHAEGGAALVAAYGVARTLPAMVVTPAVVGATDRIAPDRVLRLTVAARAFLLAAAAVTAFVEGPAVVVIGAAVVGSWFSGTYRPIQASVLPWLARTPAELTAANVVAALAENAGGLAGPVVAGVALALFGIPTAIAVAAAFVMIGLLSLVRLEVPDRGHAERGAGETPIAAVAAGAADLARLAPPAGVTILVFGQTFVRGALTVLTVVIAIDVLVMGEAAVGWLTAATGVGGLVGGVAAAGLLSADRLARGFIAGLLFWSLPLVALALVPHPVTAYAAMGVVGIGNALEDVSLFTLMPRAFRPRFVGRALGALELTVFAGIGLGSLAAPLLVDTLGALGALGLLGGGLAALAVLYSVRFARLDATLPKPGPNAPILRLDPIFSTLPMATVELLASRVSEHEFEPGAVVMRQGDPGDRYHVVTDGRATVTVDGEARNELSAGHGFGEIALIRDVPRTATVTATTPLRTISLPRDEFLAAIGSSRLASATAESTAEERLGADVGTDD
ncbi:MAG: cyclic nucleotide-binding domain-containing protein [Chloroflexi bacterium]|nr:cyclic nucleotide-binding domain-containing protein [Chloroflexota bacterium]